MKKHIFYKEGKKILVDGESLSIYLLDDTEINNINNNNSDELKNMIENINLDIKDQTKVEKPMYDRCHRLILNIDNYCNLKCSYCYASGGNYNKHIGTQCMNISTVEKTIKSMLQIYKKGIDTIQFFGGEPLLNIKFIEDAIILINRICCENNINIPKYTIVTNGTIIDEECNSIFNKYFESVTISLDGNKYINDKCRKFRNTNQSVFETVVGNIKELKKLNHNYLIGIETTVTKYHIEDFIRNQTLDYIDLFYDMGIDYISISCVFDMCNCGVGMEQCNKKDILRFFDQLEKKVIKLDYTKKSAIDAIYAILKILKTRQYPSNVCKAGTGDLCIDLNGDIYPCFMFTGNEKYKLNNVNDFDINKFLKLKSEIIDTPVKEVVNNVQCKECWAYKMCGIGMCKCIGSREFINNDVSKPIDLYCDIFKARLERIIYEIAMKSKKGCK